MCAKSGPHTTSSRVWCTEKKKSEYPGTCASAIPQEEANCRKAAATSCLHVSGPDHHRYQTFMWAI
eukprot:5066844-Karenia_brevis.AAC.1